MYQNPVLFDPVSNRESWLQFVQVSDEDTGDLIALTDSSGNALYDIELQLMPASPRTPWMGLPSSFYYDSDYDVILSVSLADYLSIPDTGTIQIKIPKSVMETLRAQTYDAFMTITDTANDDGRQLLIGRLPVLFGGRST